MDIMTPVQMQPPPYSLVPPQIDPHVLSVAGRLTTIKTRTLMIRAKMPVLTPRGGVASENENIGLGPVDNSNSLLLLLDLRNAIARSRPAFVNT
jgi:hypothetical protein